MAPLKTQCQLVSRGIIPSSPAPWVPVWSGSPIPQELAQMWGHRKPRLGALGLAPHS